eukprot:8069257-Pyramimonas_sp.AAC.1
MAASASDPSNPTKLSERSSEVTLRQKRRSLASRSVSAGITTIRERFTWLVSSSRPQRWTWCAGPRQRIASLNTCVRRSFQRDHQNEK